MDNTQSYRTISSEETQAIGEKLASDLILNSESQRILPICLYGDLGTGKTTFTQGFLRKLGVTGRVLSPTYTFVREYDLPTGKRLYHLDLYRIDTTDESLNIKEILEKENVVVVMEWAERIQEHLPQERHDIFFKILEDGTHTIQLSRHNAS